MDTEVLLCLDFVWIDLYASGWDVFMELTTKHRSVLGNRH